MNAINSRKDRATAATQRSSRPQRGLFGRQSRRHDPLLVLSMSRFNFADGWDRAFSPIKSHERGI